MPQIYSLNFEMINRLKKYKAIGFDFDNTFAFIDKFHKDAWIILLERLNLVIDIKELFINKVTVIQRFDNYGNIYKSFFENPNIIKFPFNELSEKVNELALKNGVQTFKSTNNISKTIYELKEVFLRELLLNDKQLNSSLNPIIVRILDKVERTNPKPFIFIASSSSRKTIEFYLNLISFSDKIDLMLGDENWIKTDELENLFFSDKPSKKSALTTYNAILKQMNNLLPEEIVYIGDDYYRDGLFAENASFDFIYLNKSDIGSNILETNGLNSAIKICRVNDIHTARYLARMGVEFLGLHIIYEIPEANKLRQLQQIQKEIKENYPHSKTVLVTRSESTEDIALFHQLLPADFIQVHSNMDINSKVLLNELIIKSGKKANLINVISANETKTINKAEIFGKYCLIDTSFHGGTGEEVNQDKLRNLIEELYEYKLFIAGGINENNILEKEQIFSPFSLDLQTSIENNTKKKDILKVKSLFKQFRGDSEPFEIPTNKSMFSLSIQTIPEVENIDFNNIPIDSIHLDYSDGSIVENWLTNLDPILEFWSNNYPFIPIDIHIFSSNVSIKSNLERLIKLHPNIRKIYYFISNKETAENFVKLSQQISNISISFNYNIDKSVLDYLFYNVHYSSRSDLMICLPKAEKPNYEFEIVSLNLVKTIKKIYGKQKVRIGFDREVDENKVALGAMEGVSHFVIGKALKEPDMSHLLVNLNSFQNIYEKSKGK